MGEADSNHRIKLLKTALLVFTWFSRGYENSLIGATMPDLRVRFSTDAAGLSYAMSIGTIGSLIGAWLSTFLDRYGKYFDAMIGTLLFTMAVATAFRTCHTYLWLFTLCDFINELCWYTYNPGGKSMILAMWGLKAAPYMHAALLGYPIGATFGPLVAGFFVSTNSTSSDTSNNSDTSEALYRFEYSAHWLFGKPDAFAETDTYDDSASDSRYPDGSNIQYAYYIGSCFLLTASILFFVFYYISRRKNLVLVKRSSYTWGDIFSPSKWTEGLGGFGICMLSLMIVFFIAHNNQGDLINIFLPTYAVDSGQGFTNQEAANLISVYSFSGSVGRIVSIFISNYIAINILFMFHVHTAAFAMLLVAIFGTNSKTNLYIFIAIFGFIFQPIRGYTYAFMNQYMIMISSIFGFEQFTVQFFTIFLQALHGYLYDVTFIEIIFYLAVLYGVVYVIVANVKHLLGRRYGTLVYRRSEKSLVQSDNDLQAIETEVGNAEKEKPMDKDSDSIIEKDNDTSNSVWTVHMNNEITKF